jgi:hypothetical protein
MLDVLLKKAKGYVVTETTQEFCFDEEGNKKLLKEKVSNKSVPPDLPSIKTYLEYVDNELYSMTSKELEDEKARLIGTLKKSKKVKEKNDKKDK